MKLWENLKRSLRRDVDLGARNAAPESVGGLLAADCPTDYASEASASSNDAKLEPRPQSLPQRILFVQEDPEINAWLQRCVAPLREWELEVAGAAEDALERVARTRYDAVVADLPNPVQKGLELLEQVSNVSAETLRCLRCRPAQRGEIRVVNGPAPEYLSSDFDAPTLASALERALQVHVWMEEPQLRNLTSQIRRVPSLPSIYTQVMTELNKMDGSIQEVGSLISQEPALTAKILQLVNSAVLALPRLIDDPAEAVFFLGSVRTKSLILLAHSFLHFDKANCPGFSHERLWRHSLSVGSLAETIARQQTHHAKIADLAFTAGILHDLGQLVFAANLGETYSQVIAQAERRRIPLWLVEREVFGVSHAEVGACLLGTWNLPLPIIQAIYWHHQPGGVADNDFSPIAAVHIADALEHERLPAASSPGHWMDENYVRRIGVSEHLPDWRARFGGRAARERDADNRYHDRRRGRPE